MAIVLVESIFLAVGGGVIGMFLGHRLNWLAATKLIERTGV
jgi:hypothetical protein